MNPLKDLAEAKALFQARTLQMILTQGKEITMDNAIERAEQSIKAEGLPMDKEKVDLEAIEARANAATPGPWVKDGEGTKGHIKSVPNPPIVNAKGVSATPTVCKYQVWTDLGLNLEDDFGHVKDENPNGEFIAHARQDIPALLALARSQASQLAESQALIAELTRLRQMEGEEVRRLREALDIIANMDGDEIDKIALDCTRIAATALRAAGSAQGTDGGLG